MRRSLALSAALAAAVVFPWVITHYYGGTIELGDRSLFGGIGLEPGTLVLFSGSGLGFSTHSGNQIHRNLPGLITLHWTLTGIDPWGNFSPRETSFNSFRNFYFRIPLPLIFVFPLAFLPAFCAIFKRAQKKSSSES